MTDVDERLLEFLSTIEPAVAEVRLGLGVRVRVRV